MAIPEGYEKLAAIGIAYKGVYAESTAYKYLNAVFYSGSTFVALKDNPVKPPVSDGTNWQYLAQGFVEGVMSAVNATDTSGVIGTVGEEVNAQTLIDAIADRVMTKLVPTSKIVNNLLATDAGTVLAGPQGKALSDSIAEVNSKLTVGSVASTAIPSGLNGKSITVTFPTAFVAPPKVFVTLSQFGSYMSYGVVVTTTNFTVTILNNYTTELSVSLNWMAVKA